MSDKDQIKELFSEKLGNFEAKVNPELWTNIASQVGTASTSSAAAGSSILTKVIIGVSSAAVLTTGVVLYSNSVDDKTPEKETTTVTENRQEKQQSRENKEKTILVTPDEGTQNDDNTSLDAQPRNVQEIPSIQNSQGAATQEKDDNNQTVLNETDQAGGSKIVDNSANETATAVKEDPKAVKEDFKTNDQGTKVTPQDNLAKEDNPLKDVPATNPKDNKEEPKPFKLENLTNIFTPDGDGNNDEFFLELPALKSFQIVIMDQNGQTVFESNDQNFRWNGTNMRTGNRVMKGIHSYIIIAENEEGQVVKANEFLMVNF